jgi:hypothetical protein
MPPGVTEVSINIFEEDISVFFLRLSWEDWTAEVSKNNLALLTLRKISLKEFVFNR